MSSDEQQGSGAGLEAQRRAIAAECKRRGWRLVEVVEEAGFSAKGLKRPGIQEALRVLEIGDAKALVAAKLDRLSRSMLDLSALIASAQKQGWALVALDCGVDTTTPAGEGATEAAGGEVTLCRSCFRPERLASVREGVRRCSLAHGSLGRRRSTLDGGSAGVVSTRA